MQTQTQSKVDENCSLTVLPRSTMPTVPSAQPYSSRPQSGSAHSAQVIWAAADGTGILTAGLSCSSCAKSPGTQG